MCHGVVYIQRKLICGVGGHVPAALAESLPAISEALPKIPVPSLP